MAFWTKNGMNPVVEYAILKFGHRIRDQRPKILTGRRFRSEICIFKFSAEKTAFWDKNGTNPAVEYVIFYFGPRIRD